MLASISPVGEHARRQRWGTTAAAYTVASVAGGAAIGALAGLTGAVLARAGVGLGPPTAVAVLAVLAVAGAAVDLAAVPLRLPSWHRQVDERWLTTYRGWVYGAGFGFQLGFAVLTIVAGSVTYLTLAAAALSGSWTAGTLIGATFGTARALPLLLSAPVRTVPRLHALHRGLAAAERPVAVATPGVQVVLVVVGLALVVVA